jgi:hypothetical protein
LISSSKLMVKMSNLVLLSPLMLAREVPVNASLVELKEET